MDAKIIEFVELLCDNNIKVRLYGNPQKESEIPFYYSTYEFNKEDKYKEFHLDLRSFCKYLITEAEIHKDMYVIRFYLNGHWKPINLYYFLESEYSEFEKLISHSNDINPNKIGDWLERIYLSEDELRHRVTFYNKSNFALLNSLAREKAEWCRKVMELLRKPTHKNEPILEKKKAKKAESPENMTTLTQNQIVILFHYLRELGFIGKGLPKNEYAEAISKLTGFSSEKLRQKLSHIESKSTSTESIEFTEVDFRATRRIFTEISSEITNSLNQKF